MHVVEFVSPEVFGLHMVVLAFTMLYVGGIGTIGGPILIPGTRFNKNRNKLFFFTGFEYYYQVLDTGLLRATVPTEVRTSSYARSMPCCIARMIRNKGAITTSTTSVSCQE